MKVNKKYLEELDLMIKFMDKTIVCSDNLSYKTYVLKYEKNCHNTRFSFVSKTNESAKLTSYSLTVNGDDEVTITAGHQLLICAHDEGLKFSFDGEDIDIKRVYRVINDNFSLREDIDRYIYLAIEELSFNCHKNRLGFTDVYCNLRENYKSYRASGWGYVEYFYYYSTPAMYAVAERLIKLDMAEDIHTYNPYVSHKPIPDANDIKTLSAISREIISEGSNYSHLNMIDIMTSLEKNPNVGVNGLKMFKEVIDLYNDVDLPYDCDLRIYESLDAELLNKFDVVTRQFNISTKTLINRMIKALFYELLSISEYLDLCSDYIRISKLLNLEIPTKMPKDIIREHDLVSSQYEYIKDKVIEEAFEKQAAENKLLLNTLPESKTLTIVSPMIPNDLINEGLHMNHCVGTYVERYASGMSKIFFVRKKDDVERSYVTIELNKYNKLVQARGFCNSSPDNETRNFIDDWVHTL